MTIMSCMDAWEEEKATRMREAEEKLNEAISKHMEEKSSKLRKEAISCHFMPFLASYPWICA